MSYTKKVGGLFWYYCLIPKENNKALFSDYPRSTLLNQFIVCWDFLDDGKVMKLYRVFNNYLDFAKFFLLLPDSLKSFYEIILGEHIQKPHFDLDMELTNEEILEKKDEIVLNNLLNVIVFILQEKNIHINLEKDICLYESHGGNKKSYHIIVNNYCHANNKEAKTFYYMIMSKLPKEYFEKKYIDCSVYSKTQQFRTYKSCKSGSTRIKNLIKNWKYNGIDVFHKNGEIAEDLNHEFLINLEESIISARNSNCKILPLFERPDEFEKKVFSKGENIDYDLAMEAIHLLAHFGGTTINDNKFPYKLDRIETPFVILKRVRPSKCRLCNRIHHHQNPYLLIVPETKNVFFHCRRAAPDKKLYIGSLKSEDELNNDESNKNNESKDESNKNNKTNKPNESNNQSNQNKINQSKINEEAKIKKKWTLDKINELKELASSSNPLKKTKNVQNKNKIENFQYTSLILNNYKGNYKGKF